MKENKSKDENELPTDKTAKTDRRKFLGHLTKAGIAATVGAIGAKPFFDGKSSEVAAQIASPSSQVLQTTSAIGPGTARAIASGEYRINTAIYDFQHTSFAARLNNGDEALYAPRYFANFTKGMPHQNNGEVVASAYQALLAAVNSGDPADFDAIPLGANPGSRFTSPQSGFAFDLEGKDAFSFTQPPAPAFASREEAAEIAENYWMSLLRDVPFNDYAASAIAVDACADLNQFGADFKGPKVGGLVTPDTLFCGLTAGDLNGPFLSQFFLEECNFGANVINQQVRTVLGVGNGGQNYMTNFSTWLAVQRGVPQGPQAFDPQLRYMRNGRDTGQWVHIDVLFQAYFQALLILFGIGTPFDAGNPYIGSPNQNGFATFGGPHIAALMCEVASRALKAVWNQKWLVHRRLRPEVFAERCDRASRGIINYPVHPDILTSLNSATRLGKYFNTANKLLPMAFPEGSPTHPAYGAGHATVAGACTTVLKAWFDESFVIPNPVVTDSTGQIKTPYIGAPLTIGGELNKIASNVANSRNIAGVHWRSDSTQSLKLGEAVAISILRDQRASYNEVFNGFSLTKFDGTTITV
ncbi:MAG: vanadium-dependent haloperoxidase [Actinomycetota bacterium]